MVGFFGVVVRLIIRTLRGVGGLNTYNKDLIRPIYRKYCPPPYPSKGPYELSGSGFNVSGSGTALAKGVSQGEI